MTTTDRWLTFWQPDDSPFPAVVTHATATAAHAHAIYVTKRTGFRAEVRAEERKS